MLNVFYLIYNMPPTPQRHVELYDYTKAGRIYQVDAELTYEDGITETLNGHCIREKDLLGFICAASLNTDDWNNKIFEPLDYLNEHAELMVKEYLRLQYMCEQMKRRAA
jgi:hypothetical protein